jgi:hypothetical protein
MSQAVVGTRGSISKETINGGEKRGRAGRNVGTNGIDGREHGRVNGAGIVQENANDLLCA